MLIICRIVISNPDQENLNLFIRCFKMNDYNYIFNQFYLQNKLKTPVKFTLYIAFY